MTITFENDNNTIVYALEKIIAYARENRYIFVAKCVWWIASIIGLPEGLVIYIDNLCKRSKVCKAPLQEIGQLSVNSEGSPKAKDEVNPFVVTRSSKQISATPRDTQEDSRIDLESGYIHSQRISQIDNTTQGICSLELSGSDPDRTLQVIKETDEFIKDSRKERKTSKKKPALLSRTRSGKIPAKPLSKQQRNYLQSIPKDTISAYLIDRN